MNQGGHGENAEKINEIIADWNRSQQPQSAYEKFLLCPGEKLGRTELHLIAFAYRKKIHIYQLQHDEEDESYSASIIFKETFNPRGDDEHFILFVKEHNWWQKLTCNPNRKQFIEQRLRQASAYRNHLNGAEIIDNDDNTSSVENDVDQDDSEDQEQTAVEETSRSAAAPFEELVKQFKDLTQVEYLNRYFVKLDPELGVPVELSDQLVARLQNHPDVLRDPDDPEGLNGSVPYLVEQVVDCTVNDGDLTSYAYIVNQICPNQWKRELFLKEIEDQLQTVFSASEKNHWREYLNKLSDEIFSLLRRRLNRQMDRKKLLQIVEILSVGLDLNVDDRKRLCCLPLNDWLYDLKGKYWKKELASVPVEFSLTPEEEREAVYHLLELENKQGSELCRQRLNRCRYSTSWKDLSAKLEFNHQLSDKSQIIDHSIAYILRSLISYIIIAVLQIFFYFPMSVGIKPEQHETQLYQRRPRSYDQLLKIMKKNTSNLIIANLEANRPSTQMMAEMSVLDWAKSKRRQFEMTRNLLNEFLTVFDKATKQEMGFTLRDTQQLTIKALLLTDDTTSRNRLAQVSTGEGKSLIVAAVAIARVLSGRKVDIITSNSILAVRDSTPTTEADDNGSVADIYKAFGISVTHNCSANEEERIKAYNNSDVVYGELSNFQKDYLQQMFYGRNIRGDRTFDCVIVDEVDW